MIGMFFPQVFDVRPVFQPIRIVGPVGLIQHAPDLRPVIFNRFGRAHPAAVVAAGTISPKYGVAVLVERDRIVRTVLDALSALRTLVRIQFESRKYRIDPFFRQHVGFFKPNPFAALGTPQEIAPSRLIGSMLEHLKLSELSGLGQLQIIGIRNSHGRKWIVCLKISP